MKNQKKKEMLPDNICDGMKSFALAVCTLHKFDSFEVNFIWYLTFQAIGKGRGRNKPSLHRKFPCMDAKPAVIDRLLLIRKALHVAFLHGNYPVRVHSFPPISYLWYCERGHYN